MEISKECSDNHHKCADCNSTFSTSSNLRKHVKKFHVDKLMELAPYKPKPEYQFSCSHCGKNFNVKRHLKFHLKTHGVISEGSNACISGITPLTDQNKGKGSKKCPLCSYQDGLKSNLIKHFQHTHDIVVTSEVLHFTSEEEFIMWKNNTEIETKSRYVIENSSKRKTHYYTCHRSGQFTSKAKGIRHIKIQGSKKIGGFCPAGLKLTWQNESLNVIYVSTHVGHKHELCHLNLTSSERKLLATKMASKIPMSVILDEVRDSVSDEAIQRIHLLTSKDLRNIKNCFNLDGVRHHNDVAQTSTKMNNSISGRVPTSPTGKMNGSSSNIPLRKQPAYRCSSSPLGIGTQPSRMVNSNTRNSFEAKNSTSRSSVELSKWKNKYEEAEVRRKGLLSEKEKALRHCKEIEKKYIDLQVKHEQLETELFEKNEEFTRLTTASKNLFREYEILKNQYETETGAMKKVASQWYKENKELKRRTLILTDMDAVDEGVDEGERESNPDSELDNLNKTIKQLSTEVAELQTELDSVKQTEFQTSELNVKLSEELEIEKERNGKLEHDLSELKRENEQLLRISEMLKTQVQELQEFQTNIQNNVVTLRREADDYKRERNVLAHQSTILLQGFHNEGEGPDCVLLLGEIEDLKRTLEDERNKHNEDINSLQEKLEELESNSQVEVLEERIELIESELQSALARAEAAEEKLNAPPAPPLPPPPPPPPILPDQPPVVPLRVKRRSRANIHELAQTIGVQECEEKSKAAAGVNEDIINAIKQGKFTLRKAKNENKKEKDTPKAVSELLNILGNLRRAPKKRQSQYIPPEALVQI